MKRFKKYLLGLVAVLTLSMAAPQTANARVHRYWDGEVYGEWLVNL